MSLFSNVRRWIGPSAPGALVAAAAAGASSSTPFADAGDDSVMRKVRPGVLRVILGVVLRDVQLRAALTAQCLDLEIVECDGPVPGTRGLRVRLVLKVWAPRVVASAPQLERLFLDRLFELDPEARRWFAGLSWRFDFPTGEGPGESPAEGERGPLAAGIRH